MFCRRQFIETIALGAAASLFPLVIRKARAQPVVQVTSASQFQSALNVVPNGGSNRIRIMNSFTIPRPGIVIRAFPETIIESEPGAVLLHSGTEYKGIRGTPSPSRSVYFYDVTVDGGWNKKKSEHPNDAYSPWDLSGYGRAEFHRCRTQFSRRAGLYATGCGILVIDSCSFYGICRDAMWTNGTIDWTITNSDIRHCRDDSGCHTNYGQVLPLRRVRCMNNYFRDAHGIKFLGGGDVLVEGNTFDIPGPYGVRLGSELSPPQSTGEGRPQSPSGYVVRNNRFNHCTLGEVFGNGNQFVLHMFDVGRSTGCRFENNTMANNNGGLRITDIFAEETKGCFGKNGWFNPILTPSGLSVRFHCANATDTLVNVDAGTTRVGTGWGSTERQNQ